MYERHATTYALRLEPIASGLEIIHADANVAKSLRLGVSIVIFEVGILFCSIVPSEFKKPLRVVFVGRFVAQEIQIEPGRLHLQLFEPVSSPSHLCRIEGFFRHP